MVSSHIYSLVIGRTCISPCTESQVWHFSVFKTSPTFCLKKCYSTLGWWKSLVTLGTVISVSFENLKALDFFLKWIYLWLQQRVFPWQHFSHAKIQVIIVKYSIFKTKCVISSLLSCSVVTDTFRLKFSKPWSLEIYPLQIWCWSKKLKNEETISWKLCEQTVRSLLTDAVTSAATVSSEEKCLSKWFCILRSWWPFLICEVQS